MSGDPVFLEFGRRPDEPGAIVRPGARREYPPGVLDRLTADGVLFTRFFANGTHTHQGTFVSLACFPNLPGFEYLMQTPEGSNDFSGLPQLLGRRKMDNLYVYNGDFAWDNQSGFFGRQGVTKFIGRFDYKNPVVSDPTWGVSDQDMFDRAAEELGKQSAAKPFYAILQTLSNHTPYALPERLPVDPVTGHGSLDPLLTAMRYSDWALGQFFEKIRNAPYYRETLFVIVGDHGFGGCQRTAIAALGDAGPVGDVVDRRGGHPPRGEQRGGRGDDQAPGARPAGHLAGGRRRGVRVTGHGFSALDAQCRVQPGNRPHPFARRGDRRARERHDEDTDQDGEGDPEPGLDASGDRLP